MRIDIRQAGITLLAQYSLVMMRDTSDVVEQMTPAAHVARPPPTSPTTVATRDIGDGRI